MNPKTRKLASIATAFLAFIEGGIAIMSSSQGNQGIAWFGVAVMFSLVGLTIILLRTPKPKAA